METKQAYRDKVEARIEHAQARLLHLRASAREMSADARIALAKRIDALDSTIEDSKSRLAQIMHAGEDKWGELKASLEAAWDKVTESTSDADLPVEGKDPRALDTDSAAVDDVERTASRGKGIP